MAEVTSPFIWYPNGYPGSAYDLRKVVAWGVVSGDATKLRVQFLGNPLVWIPFDKDAFETAIQASLDAEAP